MILDPAHAGHVLGGDAGGLPLRLGIHHSEIVHHPVGDDHIRQGRLPPRPALEIAHTVATPGEIEIELRELIAALPA